MRPVPEGPGAKDWVQSIRCGQRFVSQGMHPVSDLLSAHGEVTLDLPIPLPVPWRWSLDSYGAAISLRRLWLSLPRSGVMCLQERSRSATPAYPGATVIQQSWNAPEPPNGSIARLKLQDRERADVSHAEQRRVLTNDCRQRFCSRRRFRRPTAHDPRHGHGMTRWRPLFHVASGRVSGTPTRQAATWPWW